MRIHSIKLTNLPLLGKLLPGQEPVVCRYCGSTDVRPSHKAHAGTHHIVYRCRNCKQHFKVSIRRRFPSIPPTLGISLFVVVVLVASAAFYLSADDAGQAYLPDVTTADSGALAQLEQAAVKGNAQAQYDLARAKELKDDFVAAFSWASAAAQQGHRNAQHLLGTYYLHGQGTVQNYRAAMEQFTKAAEQGHLEAQYQLGLFYRDGLASPPDKETAYVWLNIAAARGHADGLVARDKLMLAMTGDEISRAQEASAKLHQQFRQLDTASR